MKRKSLFYLFYFVCLTTAFGQAQTTRISVELNAGIPYMFGSISSNISVYGGLGVRYNLIPALSAQFSFNIGTMKGSQVQTEPRFVYPEEVSNYKSYHSGFYNYALRGQLNLERVFNLRSFKFFRRMNPYLVGGVGYTSPVGDGWVAERYYGASTKTYKNGISDIFTTQVGAVIRINMSPLFDLNIGSEFNYCPTSYLDGIYPDNKYDHYLTNYIGVNVKLGSSKVKQHIEWQNVIPREHKPKKQPKEEYDQPTEPVVAQNTPNPDSVMAIVPTQIDSNKQDSIDANNEQPDSASLIVETPIITDTATAVTQKPTIATKPAIVVTPIVKAPPAKNTKPVTAKQDTVKRTFAAADKNASTSNIIEEVFAKPPAKYTVIGGAYSTSKIKYAYMFRDRLRELGYPAALVQSNINPNIVRVMIHSTNNKKVAIQQCLKARKEIEKTTWIYVAK